MAPKRWSSCHARIIIILVTVNLLILLTVVSDAEVDCPNRRPPHHKSPPSPVKPKPKPPRRPGCPRDALKLGVCTSVLNGKANFSMGVPNSKCCSFFHGLMDMDAAVCLCTALKANVLGFQFDIPVSFTFLFNFCALQAPSGFLCH